MKVKGKVRIYTACILLASAMTALLSPLFMAVRDIYDSPWFGLAVFGSIMIGTACFITGLKALNRTYALKVLREVKSADYWQNQRVYEKILKALKAGDWPYLTLDMVIMSVRALQGQDIEMDLDKEVWPLYERLTGVTYKRAEYVPARRRST